MILIILKGVGKEAMEIQSSPFSLPCEWLRYKGHQHDYLPWLYRQLRNPTEGHFTISESSGSDRKKMKIISESTRQYTDTIQIRG